jgi:hypothetical protein
LVDILVLEHLGLLDERIFEEDVPADARDPPLVHKRIKYLFLTTIIGNNLLIADVWNHVF